MQCTKCGAELAPGTKFCVSCGTPVEAAAPEEAAASVEVTAPVAAVEEPVAPVATETPEKKEGFKLDVTAIKDQLVETLKPVTNLVKPILAKKPVKIGIIVALVVILAVSIVGSILTNGNGYVQMAQQTLFEQGAGEIKIVVDKKVLKDTIESEGYNDYDSSLNGKVTALLTEEDELYVINGTKVVKVADEVSSYQLSVTGGGIAYLTKDEDYYTLSLYNVGNKKTTTISDEVVSSTIAIAPDGKSVAYYEQNDDDERVLMFSKGKDPVKITSSKTRLYGIANGGKYIFATRENDEGQTAMYSFNTKGEPTKLGDMSSSTVRFNEAHTQVMFFNESKTYISTNGKEAVKASSNKLNLIYAPNAGSFSDSNSVTYPVSNFYDHVYTVTDDSTTSVWMIKKNADKNVKLVSKVSSVKLDESAEYLYYLYDKDELRVIKISDGEKATDRYVELANDVDNFLVTSDRKLVYYESDGSIYSVNGQKGGKSTTVCADGAEDWALNGKDVLFYVMDDDLYATGNGKKGSKVLSDITSLSSTRTGIVYASNDDTVYVSDGSKKPSKLMDLD